MGKLLFLVSIGAVLGLVLAGFTGPGGIRTERRRPVIVCFALGQLVLGLGLLYLVINLIGVLGTPVDPNTNRLQQMYGRLDDSLLTNALANFVAFAFLLVAFVIKRRHSRA